MNPSPEATSRALLPVWARWVIGLGVLVGLTGLVTARGPQIMQAVRDPEALAAAIRDAGAMGAVFMVGLQVLQVVVAPIPGQVINFAAGYVYGFPIGFLLSWIGTTLGAALAMMLARFIGRPVVERLASPRFLARADRLMAEKGLLFFFVLFVLPFLPDDAICLVAGLTPLPLSALILAAAVGRTPALAVSVWLGANAGVIPGPLLIGIGIVGVILMVIVWRYGEQIETILLEFVARFEGL